jgi:N-acetylmuramoyl-L-alanine amidase
MITAVLFAALQFADSVTAVTVRHGARSESVPIVFTRSGPLVRASQVLPPLGATLSRRPPDGLVIAVAGTTIEFTLGLPFARVGGQAAPTGAPLVRDGEVFLPLAVFSEVLPRYANGFRWDSASATLVRTTVVVERAGTVGPASSPASSGTARRPAPRPLVVVDAGHGGRDRGMNGLTGARQRIYEADITLAIARKLRVALQARDIDVLMTRNSDTLIALRDRGRIANQRNGTLFLSIHVNAANPRWKNPRTARGFETYFLSDAKTEDERRVAEMENEADRFLDLDAEPGDPLSFLLSDMRQNEFLRESSTLASAVQAGLKPMHPSRNDRGVKQAGFAVLIAAHMPAVLIEVGFGTNASEAAWLASTKGQQQLAEAIAKATGEYLADYARRGGATLGAR